MMYRLIAVLLACVCLPAYAQPTCTAATTTPTAARDEARINIVPPALNVDGTAVGMPLTYRIYRATGTSYAVQCQTTALSVSMLAQPVGVQNYRVTAQFPGSQESDPSNVVSKTILAPKPNPPSISLLEQLVAWLRSVWGRFA